MNGSHGWRSMIIVEFDIAQIYEKVLDCIVLDDIMFQNMI